MSFKNIADSSKTFAITRCFDAFTLVFVFALTMTWRIRASRLIFLQVPALRSASLLSHDSSSLLLIGHQHTSRDSRNLTNTASDAPNDDYTEMCLNSPVGIGWLVIQKLSSERSTGENKKNHLAVILEKIFSGVRWISWESESDFKNFTKKSNLLEAMKRKQLFSEVNFALLTVKSWLKLLLQNIVYFLSLCNWSE